MTKKKIAVLGQGPSGCAAAHTLDQLAGPNVDIHLLGQDLAGRASTVKVDDVYLDLGASLLTDAYTRVLSYVRDLGLSASLIPLTVTGTVRRDDGALGTLTLNNPTSILTYPLLSAGQKLKLVGPLLGLSAIGVVPGFDLMSLDSVAWLDGARSMERYFQDEIGQEALDNLGTIFTNLLRTTPDLVPEGTFKAWYTRPSIKYHVMVTGMGAIWSAMASRLMARHTVKSGVTATGITPKAGSGYTVELDDGMGPRKEDYDAVILALPSTQIKAVAGSLLSPVARGILDERTYGESGVGIYRVSVAKSTPYAEGLLFPCGSRRHDIGVVHLHRRHKLNRRDAAEDFAYVYPQDHFLSTLDGLSEAAALDAIYARAQAELSGSTAWIANPPLEKVRLARYRYGTLAYPLHARPTLLSQHLAASQVGSRLQIAGGFTEQPVPDCMETAARSGEKAAKRLLSALFGRSY